MKGKEHLWIHDKGISALMIVVFCMSFFVVINVIRIQNQKIIGEEQKSREQYADYKVYQYEHLVSDGESDTEQREHKLRIDKLGITKGNVILIFNTLIGNAYYSAPLHLVISYNEPLVEVLKEGRYPTEMEIAHGRKSVVVGEHILRFAEQRGKSKVLKIDNVSYEILGVLKDITGNSTDNRLFIFGNCIASKTIENINEEYFMEIEYGSNYESLDQARDLESWLYQFDAPEHFSLVDCAELDEYGDMTSITRLMRQYNQYVMYILFAFCMGSCFMVSSVWVKRRRREMVIRKALGSSYWKTVGVLCKDVGIMLVLSVLIDILFFAVQNLLVGGQWLEQTYLLVDFLYLFAACLIVIIVTLLQPLYVVATISPAEGTRAL